ncbi:MAG TPA: DUF72 domain-containing protein [Verrucomicrobiae bacterium]|nr:DUF72 domain-containing protein [Verrucomicrobiae bacterium]
MIPRVFIGTSGYSYKSWDKTFYGETPKRRQLEFYATEFPTVEINATFYRLPSEGMVRGWANRVSEDFVYAVKGSRFITHMKKLVNLDGALDKFFDRILPMKERTGIILWQLPGMLRKDAVRLDEFLAKVPKNYRHAFEFRHPSWYDSEIFEILQRHKAAHVALSSGGMPMNLSVTTDIVYVRFHGLAGGAAHDYTRAELRPWAKFIREQAVLGRRLYVYFNNDINVRAPENAKMLMEMVGEHCVYPKDGEMKAEVSRDQRAQRVSRDRSVTRARGNPALADKYN